MAQSASLHDTNFELDGNFGELGRLVESVDQFCQAAGLDADAAFELNLALEELFANAVRHGGCEGMKNAVEVRLRLAEHGGVAVEFRDRGAPFDPTSVAEPDLAASAARISTPRAGWSRAETRSRPPPESSSSLSGRRRPARGCAGD